MVLVAGCLAGGVFADGGTGVSPVMEDAAQDADGTVSAPPAADDHGQDAHAAGGREWISGSFRNELDASWSDRDSDLDMSQTLRLNIDPASHPRLHLRG